MSSNIVKHSKFNLYSDPTNNYTVHPINNKEIWDMYKKELACFWTVEEVDLSKDRQDWENKLNDNERKFINFHLTMSYTNRHIRNHFNYSIV